MATLGIIRIRLKIAVMFQVVYKLKENPQQYDTLLELDFDTAFTIETNTSILSGESQYHKVKHLA